MSQPKLFFSREEMFDLNKKALESRGVTIEEIAEISYKQQTKYDKEVKMEDCIESVEKILSLRDVFHILQLGIEIDRLTEEHQFRGPIQDIMRYDLGVFGVDEILGLDLAKLYGIIGVTNFGDIDVNKVGVVARLNDEGKDVTKRCHTFLDDIVGSIAAAASTRVAQIISENKTDKNHE